MSALQTSRWAVRTRRPVVPAKPATKADALDKSARLLTRLRWKAAQLETSHAAVQKSPAAKRMFQLDFFEWYTLLERALVHLLALVGTPVSRVALANGAGEDDEEALKARMIIGSRRAAAHPSEEALSEGAAVAGHRFHANLIAVLERPTNPLFGVLGSGETAMFLARAKDLRNRWKEEGEEGVRDGKPIEEEIETEELGTMLNCLLKAMEKAAGDAERAMAKDGSMGQAVCGAQEDLDMEDAPWEAVYDDGVDMDVDYL